MRNAYIIFCFIFFNGFSQSTHPKKDYLNNLFDLIVEEDFSKIEPYIFKYNKDQLKVTDVNTIKILNVVFDEKAYLKSKRQIKSSLYFINKLKSVCEVKIKVKSIKVSKKTFETVALDYIDVKFSFYCGNKEQYIEYSMIETDSGWKLMGEFSNSW